MAQLARTWKNVLFNPKDGFKEIDENTKIFVPIIIVLVISLIAVSFMIPIITSRIYLQKSVDIQLAKMRKSALPAAVERANKSVESKTTKIIAISGAYIGSIATYLLIFYAGALVLLLLVKIFKGGNVSYKLLLRIVIFAALITDFQGLIRVLIVYFSDWQSAVAASTTTGDLKSAVQSPLSLAVFLDPRTAGKVLYFIVDYFTDIFNIIYFILIYNGLVSAGKITKNKSIGITVVYALFAALPGFIPALIM